MNKQVKGIIGGIVTIIIIVVGVFYYMEQNQKQILSKEIDSINETQKIDMTIKTTGKYAKIEKEVKDYLSNYMNTVQKLSDEYAASTFLTEAVSINNVKEDGPEFTQTKEKIAKLKEKEATVLNEIEQMITDENISKKAEEAGIKGSDKELYTSILDLDKDVENMKSLVSTVDSYMEKLEKILNFLTEHKAEWQVSSQNILFNKSTTLAEYNVLVNSLNTARTTLQLKLTNLGK